MNAERERVVAVARSFIKTPYHSHAMVKGAGVDCGTFIAMVFIEAGIVPYFDVGPYSDQWHLHSEDPLYEKIVLGQGAHPVDNPDAGDLILYMQGKLYAHGAIVTVADPLTIIHAYVPARMVIEGKESEFGSIVHEPKKCFSTW